MGVFIFAPKNILQPKKNQLHERISIKNDWLLDNCIYRWVVSLVKQIH